jgi:hypothetical protein
MRPISKAGVPTCLQTFIDGQLAIQPHPVNLTYRDFDKKSVLRDLLTSEQFGLCGYTGTPVDGRIIHYQSGKSGATFRNHIEHLKCQQACRVEVVNRGDEYGCVLADDLSYQNMIVALEVRGAQVEHFGAVAKAAQALPLLPTQAGCAEGFVFLEGDGSVDGRDDASNACISVLALNHHTLKGWRLSALSIWLDPEVVQTRDDFIRVIKAVTTPVAECLPEFAFVVEYVAKGYIYEDDL